MPLLNYTTGIDADKTVSEIQKCLAVHGASAILAEYDKDGHWWTLGDVAVAAGYLPSATPGISARIRELKNEKGIPHEKRKAGSGNLVEYRLVVCCLLNESE